MKVKITGNFLRTKEAFSKNYPQIFIFKNEQLEVDNLRKGGVLHMFTYDGEHYHGDAKYCTMEILDD